MNNNHSAVKGEFYLPSILQHYGYRTCISGKLHFKPAGSAYGFDEFYSYRTEGPDSLNWYPTYLQQNVGSRGIYPSVEGSKPYPDDPLGGDLGKYLHDPEHYETNWITRNALDFLGRQDADKPWFLFVSYNRPHSPSVLPEPHYSMYDDADLDIPELPGPYTREEWAGAGARERHVVVEPEMASKLIRSYLASISLVDDNIGKLLDLLTEKGMDENTIVVFTADHGNLLGDKGLWFKSPMWDGSSRIPMIMKVPETVLEGVKPGRKVVEIVELTDIMPTLLELIKVQDNVQGMQGKSMVPLLEGNAESWRNYSFSMLTHPYLGDQLMIVEGKYKFIHYDKDGQTRWEVFDMEEDPDEALNLAEMTEIQEMLPAIKSRMEDIVSDRPRPLTVDGMDIPAY
jgi:arylsulfatase A-like enzyme